MLLLLALFIYFTQALSGVVLSERSPHPNPYNNAHPDYAAKNLATIQQIYNNTVFPRNAAVLQTQGGNITSLFDANATGRITPLGNFTGFTDSIEYFFGLAPVALAYGDFAFFKADVVAFTSGCPEVASSVVYLYGGPVDNSTGGLLPGREAEVVILKQIAFWRFDNAGAVTRYEAWIPNIQLWFETTQRVSTADASVQRAFIAQGICPAVQQRCTGADQQYADAGDCVRQLSRKPFGSWDEIWEDNVVCRRVHLILTQFRPDVHCPHVGPTGGGKCVNADYTVEYFDDAALYGRPTPFQCSSSKMTMDGI